MKTPKINIERIASNLSLQGGIKPSINVEKVAEFLGLEIKEDDLGSDVSGVLVIKNGKGVIGVSKDETDNIVRRRFTIAHEIGHYVLHRFSQDLFIDQHNFKAVFHRDTSSSSGKVTMEREANAFAAALLMPKTLIIKELSKKSYSFNFVEEEEEDIIYRLAKEFKVSRQAMTFRLANLQIL